MKNFLMNLKGSQIKKNFSYQGEALNVPTAF